MAVEETRGHHGSWCADKGGSQQVWVPSGAKTRCLRRTVRYSCCWRFLQEETGLAVCEALAELIGGTSDVTTLGQRLFGLEQQHMKRSCHVGTRRGQRRLPLKKGLPSRLVNRVSAFPLYQKSSFLKLSSWRLFLPKIFVSDVSLHRSVEQTISTTNTCSEERVHVAQVAPPTSNLREDL